MIFGGGRATQVAKDVALHEGYTKIEANGLLEGQFLVWVRHIDTREVGYAPEPPKFASSEIAQRESRARFAEGRLLEAFLAAEAAVALAPADFATQLWHATVLLKLESDEWQELILGSLEKTLELAPADKQPAVAARLAQEKAKSRGSAPDAMADAFEAALARVKAGDLPELTQAEESTGLARAIAYGSSMPPQELAEILDKFRKLEDQESVKAVLVFWSDFFRKNPRGLDRSDIRWLDEQRRKSAPVIQAFLEDAGGLWEEASRELVPPALRDDPPAVVKAPRRPLTARENTLRRIGNGCYAVLTLAAIVLLPSVATREVQGMIRQAESALATGRYQDVLSTTDRITRHGIRGHRVEYVSALGLAIEANVKHGNPAAAKDLLARLKPLDDAGYAKSEKLLKENGKGKKP